MFKNIPFARFSKVMFKTEYINDYAFLIKGKLYNWDGLNIPIG
jgi:hypothetical protein